MADVYDSDDACNRSPALQPAVIKYGPDEPSPPFPHKRPASRDRDSPGSDGGRSRKHHRTHKALRSTQGDAVLIGILGPNRPDIAQQAGARPLRSESDSDDDYRERAVKLSPRPSIVPSSDVAKQVASDALGLVHNEHVRNNHNNHHHNNNNNNILPPISELVFPPLPYHRRGSEQVIHDGLATSVVARYTISPSNMPAQELLPALHSPPHSTAGSPENTQSLPPVQSLLRDISSVSVSSPHYGAASAPSPAGVHSRRVSTSLPPPPLPPQSQMPTPYSPAAPSPYPWRPSGFKSEGSTVSTVYETPSQGPLTGKSPANSYPTPTEPRPPGEENAEAGSLYKCQFPDCNAAPFQTQYLLNSHANVHSQERPHYCPVQDCPRGVGGKGFKRKNEMIRHGLVHDSPGYVCPFCTDQQHKYPRPDNLQRHVKAHHIDRSKDDPELRDVLSQRPKGSGRGRRRRGHT
ncbi:uncharacterized protein TRUGW13939_00394 [Talaromyces rugulosus]|uniref:C2H2-type domain-containing protein n=1 Tax=Talaromyces rugulosus TaxID=121627 RepID=A0A7H8QHF8_TALRU|nr:uncharacterized protein TRUGW13939_00394 [Talaromyces rugulosus]QKX53316.1 hypothetical protein TRUGW13939_00394 [Talaromyces rugulosus]